MYTYPESIRLNFTSVFPNKNKDKRRHIKASKLWGHFASTRTHCRHAVGIVACHEWLRMWSSDSLSSLAGSIYVYAGKESSECKLNSYTWWMMMHQRPGKDSTSTVTCLRKTPYIPPYMQLCKFYSTTVEIKQQIKMCQQATATQTAFFWVWCTLVSWPMCIA